MATYINAATAASDTVNLPSGWSPGDVAIVIAGRLTDTTVPSLPSGWTQVAFYGAAHGTIMGWRLLQSGDTTIGTWTNATHVAVAIYTGVHQIEPIEAGIGVATLVASPSGSTSGPITTDSGPYETAVHITLILSAQTISSNSLSAWTDRFGSGTRLAVCDKASPATNESTPSTVSGSAPYIRANLALRSASSFPIIVGQDTKFGTQTSNASTWTLTYPTNLASGDLILAFIGSDGEGTFTTDANFVQIANTGPVAVHVAAGARIADGTETGTFTVGLGASEQGGWRVYRIPAGTWFGVSIGTGSPAAQTDSLGVGGPASGSSSNPSPGSDNPTNWDVEDTLWIVAAAADTSRTVSVYPLPDRNSDDVSGGATGATLALCSDELAQASLDAGNFTISASDDWAALTIAVRPAAAGGATLRAYAQAQANIKATYYANSQAQADIKTTYYGNGQAQANIQQTYYVFAQAQSSVAQTFFGHAQTQANIKQIYYGLAQANVDIKTTLYEFAQAQAVIKSISFGWAQTQADIQQTYYGLAQANSDIKAIGTGFGQAQSDINATSYSLAQAQADILQVYYVHAQSQASIAKTSFGLAQAQACIVGWAWAQTQADIKQIYYEHGQVQASIEQTYYVLALAQANIQTVNYGHAQAQVNIKTTYYAVAQTQSDIKQTYYEFAQAQVNIKQAYYGSAQTQANIIQVYYGLGQSQADILATSYGSGQAQANIKAEYYGLGQAQANILQVYWGFAQAQANLLIVSYGFAQTQAKLNVYGVTNFAQAQADILVTSYVFAQAQASISTIHAGFAQTQADILTISYVWAQAQANIYLSQQARPVADNINTGLVGVVV